MSAAYGVPSGDITSGSDPCFRSLFTNEIEVKKLPAWKEY